MPEHGGWLERWRKVTQQQPLGRERTEWDCSSPCWLDVGMGKSVVKEEPRSKGDTCRVTTQGYCNKYWENAWLQGNGPIFLIRLLKGLFSCIHVAAPEGAYVPYLAIHFSKLGFDKRTAAAFLLSVISSSKICLEFMMEMYPYIGILPAALHKGKWDTRVVHCPLLSHFL